MAFGILTEIHSFDAFSDDRTSDGHRITGDYIHTGPDFKERFHVGPSGYESGSAFHAKLREVYFAAVKVQYLDGY